MKDLGAYYSFNFNKSGEPLSVKWRQGWVDAYKVDTSKSWAAAVSHLSEGPITPVPAFFDLSLPLTNTSAGRIIRSFSLRNGAQPVDKKRKRRSTLSGAVMNVAPDEANSEEEDATKLLDGERRSHIETKTERDNLKNQLEDLQRKVVRRNGRIQGLQDRLTTKEAELTAKEEELAGE